MSASILIEVDHAPLEGDLDVPPSARGVVIFAHGSGSSRFSPRNRAVAAFIRQSGHFGTLLFDLLTPEEDRSWANRFDIELLAERLAAATRAVRSLPDMGHVPIGYFGASTGAAAAIKAAVRTRGRVGTAGTEIGTPGPVDAIVSRGGRPDLAEDALRIDTIPTLLIVGGWDSEVIELNKQALALIPAREKQLEIVPGATHLFDEPGTLEEVCRLALDWYERFLGR